MDIKTDRILNHRGTTSKGKIYGKSSCGRKSDKRNSYQLSLGMNKRSEKRLALGLTKAAQRGMQKAQNTFPAKTSTKINLLIKNSFTFRLTMPALTNIGCRIRTAPSKVPTPKMKLPTNSPGSKFDQLVAAHRNLDIAQLKDRLLLSPKGIPTRQIGKVPGKKKHKIKTYNNKKPTANNN